MMNETGGNEDPSGGDLTSTWWRDDVEAWRRSIEVAEQQLRELKEAGGAIAQRAFAQGGFTAVAWLYWNTNIRAGDLAAAAGLPHVYALAAAVPVGTLVRPCDRCGAPATLKVRSRSEAEAAGRGRRGHGATCASCAAAVGVSAAGWREREEARQRAFAGRLRVLRAMPYDEYLATPEWRRAHDQALERADSCCEVCGTDELAVNVRHRSVGGTDRGDWNEDTIVVCLPCERALAERLPGLRPRAR